MTATADKLRLCYTSSDLTAHGDALPARTITAATSNTLITEDITQVSDYWNGAIGFFTATAQSPILRGHFFHVMDWDAETGTMTSYRPFPAVPQPGDVFKLAKGGKYVSSQEMPGLVLSGSQPEFNPVPGTNVTGVTITKCSGALGEGTLQLLYTNETQSLKIRMGTTNDYGTEVAFAEDETDVIIFDVYGNGWIQVNVDYDALPEENVSDSFTTTISRGTIIPNVEELENYSTTGTFRYFPVGVKNVGAELGDSMSGLGVWTEKQTSEQATIDSVAGSGTSAALTVTLASTPTNWPATGCFVHNTTKGDYRFVLNRIGNKIYTKTNQFALISFTNGNTNLVVGEEYSFARSGYSSPKKIGMLMAIFRSSSTAGSLLFFTTSTGTGTMSTTNNLIFRDSVQIQAATGPAAWASSGTYAYDFVLKNIVTTPWQVGDILEVTSELDLAIDPNRTDSNSLYDPADQYTQPDSYLLFNPYNVIDEKMMMDAIEPGGTCGIWLRQQVLPNVPAHESVLGALNFAWY
jgi:hypothetical protein